MKRPSWTPVNNNSRDDKVFVAAVKCYLHHAIKTAKAL